MDDPTKQFDYCAAVKASDSADLDEAGGKKIRKHILSCIKILVAIFARFAEDQHLLKESKQKQEQTKSVQLLYRPTL